MIWTETEFIQFVIDQYAQILTLALPITFFIGACNISFNLIFSAFMGGRLHFGGK